MDRNTHWPRVRRAALLTMLAAVAIGPFTGKAQTPSGPRIINTKLIDNERVTVSRLTFPPGVREPMHITPQDLVVIQGTAGDVEVSLGSETTKGRVEAGKTWYVSKVTQHAYSNIGKEPFDLLVVFLK